MKTTYLLKKTYPDGSERLAVASSAEWMAVVKANKLLPPEKRRYFILDYIAEKSGLDRMVIEVPYDDYVVWLREHVSAQRNRALGKNYQQISLDTAIFTENGPVHFCNIIAAEERVEDMACDQMLIVELREKLAKWKPWANDLLDWYLQGEKRTCTKCLAQKYNVSTQVVRKYKRQFEKFIKNFLKGVSF